MKKEKMVNVFILCPNDMEKPVLYFEDRDQAIEFSKTYKSGAHVSDKKEEIPERIVKNKQMHVAKCGHVL